MRHRSAEDVILQAAVLLLNAAGDVSYMEAKADAASRTQNLGFQTLVLLAVPSCSQFKALPSTSHAGLAV